MSVLILAGCVPDASNSTEIAAKTPSLPPAVTPVVPTVKPSTATVIISPISGLPGTTVQVNASGFLPNAAIVVAFGPKDSGLVIAAEGTTDMNGSFSVQIPVQGAPGMELAFAAALDGQPGVLALETFKLMNSGQPQVTIFPTGGVTGTVVQVTASGFPANKPATVGVGPAYSEYSLAAEGMTDANGFFSVQVPVIGGPGMTLIFAVSVDGQPGINATDQFQVVFAPPNPGPNDPTPTMHTDMWSKYTNTFFAVSLEHPADWFPVPGYGSSDKGITRYEGTTGFFLVGSMDTDSIDQAASHEANHVLMPYGSQPTIEKLTVQGQEARLVLPSGDQPNGMMHQAALIVRYPFVASLDWSPRYFVLYADLAHIRTIAETIRFTTQN
ncbi:hypothetical protein ACFLXB_09990 [Chloroflexota bacterium]